MKNRFDSLTKAISKQEEINNILLQAVKDQGEALKAISASVQARTVEELSPAALGLPFKNLDDIQTALKDPEMVRKLTAFASTFPKNEDFCSNLHDAIVDRKLLEHSYYNARG